MRRSLCAERGTGPLLLLVCFSLCSATSAVSTAELGALTDLFYSTGGSGWYNSTGWLESDPCSGIGWFGVECSGGIHVVGLYLSKNGLDGTLGDSIGDLYDLEELDLFGNELSGTLPDSISNLRDVEHLDISHNLFSGSIPESIGDLLLFSLSYIDCSHNSFSGFVPEFFDGTESSFQYIDLSGNDFFCPIPAWANYTHATCHYLEITVVNPTCSLPGETVVLYGDNFAATDGVECQFLTQKVPNSILYSPATIASASEILCPIPGDVMALLDDVTLFIKFNVTLTFQETAISEDVRYLGVMNPWLEYGGSMGLPTLMPQSQAETILGHYPPELAVRELCLQGWSSEPWRCNGSDEAYFDPYCYDDSSSTSVCVPVPVSDFYHSELYCGVGCTEYTQPNHLHETTHYCGAVAGATTYSCPFCWYADGWYSF